MSRNFYIVPADIDVVVFFPLFPVFLLFCFFGSIETSGADYDNFRHQECSPGARKEKLDTAL